eukprot:TRINITY_DN10635_c0_g1_i2.p1 TRINITY_DN10635_c0_g1~~TRINITY_DN10635_c0_g1_i2.p1  ORF type:complete len:1042 (+),score=209.37 TRINITY_DN10635_c0_g1_i2:205-3126(+)
MDAATAIASLQKALRNDRNNPHVWYNLGRAYLLRGSYASALKALGRSIELSPSQLEAKALFGQVQRQLGQLPAALSSYQECLAINSSYPPAVEGLLLTRLDACREALGAGLQGPASQHIAQGVELFIDTLAECQHYLCLWKHVADLLNAGYHLHTHHAANIAATLARLRCVCGLDDSASLFDLTLRLYAELVARSPTSGSWFDFGLAQYRQANRTKDTAKYQSAMLAARKSLELDKSNAEAWELLGATAIDLVHYPLAIKAFARCAELLPNEGGPWTDLGVAYLCQHNVQAANRCFSQAQALDPSLARAWIGQALVATSMGLQDALDLLRHSFELFPHPTAALGLATRVVAAITPASEQDALSLLTDGAVVFGNLGRIPAGATDAYCNQAAVALSRYCHTPDGEGNPTARCLLALLHERLQLFTAASISWQQCIDLLGDQQPERRRVAELGLARSLCLDRKLTEGVELYSRLVPIDFGHCCQWARALLQLGQLPQAFEKYNQAKQLAEQTGSAIQLANVNASLGIVAFANGDMELCKQLLFLAVQDPRVCPEAVFIMAGLGIVANDVTLTQAALAEFPRTWKVDATTDPEHIKAHLQLWSLAASALGDVTTAKRAAVRLLHTFPQDPQLHVFLAQTLNGTPGSDTSDGFAGASMACKQNLALQACTRALLLTTRMSKRSRRTSQTHVRGMAETFTTLAASHLAHPTPQLWQTGDIQAYRRECRQAALAAVHARPDSAASWATLAAATLVPGDPKQLDISYKTCIRVVGMVEQQRSLLTSSRLHEPKMDGLLRLRMWSELTACHALLLKADCGEQAEQCFASVILVAEPGLSNYASDPQIVSEFASVLGLSLWQLGRHDGAMQALSKSTHWQKVVGDRHALQGRFKSAAQSFATAPPTRFADSVKAALADVLSGSYDTAGQRLSELLGLCNSHETVRLVLGYNKKLNGDIKGCKKELKRLADSTIADDLVQLLA